MAISILVYEETGKLPTIRKLLMLMLSLRGVGRGRVVYPFNP